MTNMSQMVKCDKKCGFCKKYFWTPTGHIKTFICIGCKNKNLKFIYKKNNFYSALIIQQQFRAKCF